MKLVRYRPRPLVVFGGSYVLAMLVTFALAIRGGAPGFVVLGDALAPSPVAQGGGGGGADSVPDLLALDTATQADSVTQDTVAYLALQTDTLIRGETYLDPKTGVTVWLVSDSAWPAANDSLVGGDYGAGGIPISYPDTTTGRVGNRYLVRWLDIGSRWIYEFNPDSTPAVFNARTYLSAVGSNPIVDTGWGLSHNSATPWILYTCTGSSLLATDLRADTTVENVKGQTGNFPATPRCANWFQSTPGDSMLVGLNSAQDTAWAYYPSTDTYRSISQNVMATTLNEPHVDRCYRYVKMILNGSPYVQFWDAEADSLLSFTSTPSSGRWQSGHTDGACRQWTVGNTQLSYPPPNNYFTITGTTPTESVDTTHVNYAISCAQYVNANWAQSDSSANGQFVLFHPYDTYLPGVAGCGNPGDAWLAPGYLVYFNANGHGRILAGVYSREFTGSPYYTHPWAQQSPDGHYVMWTTTRMNKGRYDAVIAKVPLMLNPT